jgi:small-conductance mechanosensitive channel
VQGELEDIVALITIPSMFVLIAWIIFSSVRRITGSRRIAELHAKLLDRFATGQELLAYLQTEEGKRFLDTATIEHNNPMGRILGAIQAGVILTLIGIALLFLRGRISGGEDAFLGVGTVILALGIGFLISAGISYALTKSAGLLPSMPASRP